MVNSRLTLSVKPKDKVIVNHKSPGYSYCVVQSDWSLLLLVNVPCSLYCKQDNV